MQNIAGLAATLLRDAATELLPLGVLRERLTCLMPHPPGTAELYAAIEQRPDLFVTVVPAAYLAPGSDWTDDERAAYARAFASCGVAAEPHIALTHAASADRRPYELPAWAAVERGVLDLWEQAGGDPELRATLARALTELERLRAALEGAAFASP